MKGWARNLDSAGLTVLAAVSLAGCFASRTPLVPASESAKLFGDKGAATRVEFGSIGSPPQKVSFSWTGDSYAVIDPREPRRTSQYRIAPFRDQWLLTQRVDQGVALYGLAKREGSRLWTYSPACQDLSDLDREVAGAVLQADGMCWLTSTSQLRAAMSRASNKGLQPDGYFELAK